MISNKRWKLFAKFYLRPAPTGRYTGYCDLRKAKGLF